MLGANTSRLVGRATGHRQAATLSAALRSARRSITTRPNLLGLASTACEAVTLTARAACTRRELPAELMAGQRRGPLPPLWTLLRRPSRESVTDARRAMGPPLSPVGRPSFLAGAPLSRHGAAGASAAVALHALASVCSGSCTPGALWAARRHHHHIAGATALGRPTRPLLSPKQQDPAAAKQQAARANELQGVNAVGRYREEREEEREEQESTGEDPFNKSSGPGYLPFPPPFHTINIIMVLLIANVLCYAMMKFGNDDWRDFIVEHFTLSHENAHRIYPIFTNALYQENMLQLAIDCWLLWQFGDTMLAFLGNVRLTFFALLCTTGGSLIHIARQQFELYYDMDELEVRGRCYGPNPMIMGLIAMEGLIFRHLNFLQQPPVPFLVLTAFVMVIDVWRIFTTRPEEHGAATGGALMAYLFWALPTRFLGLDKLTATM